MFDRWILFEGGLQARLNALIHPSQGLVLSALDEQTLGLLDFLMLLHQAPKVLQPCAFEGAEQHHGGLPGRVFDVRVGVRCKQAQCTADVGLCAGGGIRIEIGFVDQYQVGQLHDALFDGL